MLNLQKRVIVFCLIFLASSSFHIFGLDANPRYTYLIGNKMFPAAHDLIHNHEWVQGELSYSNSLLHFESYGFKLQDSYGDGWQISQVRLTLDGEIVIDSNIPSYWDADPATRGDVGDAQWSSISTTVNIPAGTNEATWEYVAGSYPSEVTFQVTGTGGEDLGDYGPSPASGLLPIILCLQE